MSWCDRLASTPALGFGLNPAIVAQADLVRALNPILADVFAEESGQQFMYQQTDPFSLGFKSHLGFAYGIEPSKLHVTFEHHLRHKNQSGGPPVAQLISKAQPFTKLLPQVADRAIRAACLLNTAQSRNLTRIGVVSLTHVDMEDLPPGLIGFMRYVGAPWGAKVQALEMSITTELRENEHLLERCIHILKRPEQPNELMQIQLDFQVVFKNPKAITESLLKSESEQVQKRALEYFESVAEGAMFDVEIIRSVEPTPV